ncbi:MAG TPA: PAS domain S-box protein [Pyrinomonadaceae bacterium]|nr:PAS domain S-box protein [Pyrinomonadaceae bacterium]
MPNDRTINDRSADELSVLEELRRRERELSDFIENASVGLHWVGADGTILWANQAELDLLGYSGDEYIGRKITEFHADQDVINDILRRLTNRETLRDYEARLRSKDGSVRYVLINSNVMWDEDKFVHTRCFTRDITDRKLAEEALRGSETQLRTLADAVPQLVWMAEPDGYIVWYNQRWYDYTGTTPEQMAGWGWQSVHDLELLPRVLERWGASIESGEPFEMEFPLKGADGAFRWFLTRVNPLRDSQGRIVRWFGTNTDIDEQRRTAEQLREANRLKDEFLATVSHELRTPLTSILGWAHLLRTGQLDEQNVTRALETIERNARAQTQLIDDLLDVSRIITGNLRLDVRRHDPASSIESAIEALQPAAAAKNVRIQKVLDTGVAFVAGDPARLQQVVWNLLSNAIKFTPKGGVVQVRLERIDSHVEIIVSDTGKGIAAEFMPHVFERFRQADQKSTRLHGGLGIGLAIVRHLVELHGGTVQADSPGEGQGATFVVKLPMLPVQQKDDPAGCAYPTDGNTLPSYDCPERLEGLKVLVVDDEFDTRELLGVALRRCGAEVSTAGSAREALAAIEESRPDLLISDIGMPGEDGYELIGKVRALANGRGGEIPAIALTAYARTEDRLRALRAGYQMHLSKPVELAELVVVTASLTQRRNDGVE